VNGTQIIPLGTGSAVPVPGKSFSALALVRQEGVLLFDCGEGTQARLMQSRIRFSKVQAVFVSHLHGDHVFGLPGLLSTMSLLRRADPIVVVGPVGLRDILESMPGLRPGEMNYEIHYRELAEVDRRIVVQETDAYTVWARAVDHGVPAYGYRYQEQARPGNLDVDAARKMGVSHYRDFRRLKAGQSVTVSGDRSVRAEDVVGPSTPGGVFAYAGDTRPCDAVLDLAKGADILYHEATFAAGLDQRAGETGHSTTLDAARMARDAGARRLLLSHFSARYNDTQSLMEEARTVFAPAEEAIELQRYELQETPSEAGDS
jgi:ribonuclease Z